jgi:Legume lectin domain
MKRAISTAATAVALANCGTTVTDLIPRRSPSEGGAHAGDAHADAANNDVPSDSSRSDCVDSTAYPGGGFYKADFADVSDMALNEEASSLSGALRLASTPTMGRGSAFFKTTVSFDPNTSVFAHFGIRIGQGEGLVGGDGLAFILQSNDRGPNAIGSAGSGLGYNGIKPSVVIEFDTIVNAENNDPDANHVALMVQGSNANHLAFASPAAPLNDGTLRQVWIDYDGTLDLLEVYLSDTPLHPSLPLLSHRGFDFGSELSSQVYVGLSAAVGEHYNDHALEGEAWFATSQLPKCR